MINNFFKSKGGRLAIIAIVYVLCYIALQIAWAIEGSVGSQSNVTVIYILISVILGFPIATRAINYINNLIFGNLFLIGPLQMFFEIFLVKFVLRMIIACVVGPILAPYVLGKFIADLVGAK